ncbi:MAG: exosortase system-associated protein, TIGR04073 family [Omnitrophica bacterium]|nr:exosortase system-associated protein, TIGR04073 family [Candidatus Omnitrophota bacterium]
MKRILTFVVIAAVLFASQVSYAFDAEGSLRKLGRGGANVLTCIFEVPKNVGEVNYELGPVAAVTYGFLKGLYKMGTRCVIGAYEIVTAPFPLSNNYAPIINDPEFLLSEKLF